MMSIRWGRTKNTAYNVDVIFDANYEEEWLDDPLVKQMVLDVDKTEIVSSQCIVSPVLGQISPNILSGGVKALIMAWKTDWEVWATACGDNCAKWFLEIAKRKDVTISLEHLMDFPIRKFDFTDAETGELYHDYSEFIYKYYHVHRYEEADGSVAYRQWDYDDECWVTVKWVEEEDDWVEVEQA